jgi:hypothetical protein
MDVTGKQKVRLGNEILADVRELLRPFAIEQGGMGHPRWPAGNQGAIDGGAALLQEAIPSSCVESPAATLPHRYLTLLLL